MIVHFLLVVISQPIVWLTIPNAVFSGQEGLTTSKLALNRAQASIQLTITISGRWLDIWAFQFLNVCLDDLLGGIGFRRVIGNPGRVLVVDFDKYVLRSYVKLIFAGFCNRVGTPKVVNAQECLANYLITDGAVGHS